MTGWIGSTLIATTLLMVAVLLLRQPVARLFGPRAAYALWLLPALRMVLPPLPQAIAPALPVRFDVTALMQAAATAPVPAQGGHDWLAWLVTAWLAVAAARFATAWLGYRRFMASVLAGGQLLGRERGVPVYLGSGAAGPLAAGVFARRIVLPRDFHARFAAQEQRLALAHEATHHARFDIAANMLALAVLALHWWNPIAHAAWRAFRADQELACDASVLRHASTEDRHAYGSAVLKAAFGGLPAAACGMGRTGELKRRLRMMAARPSGARMRIGQIVAGGAIMLGLAATATGGAAAEQVRAIGERVRQALPVAPVAPLPPLASAAPEPPPAATAIARHDTAKMPIASRAKVANVAAIAPVAPVAPALTVLPVTPVAPIPPERIEAIRAAAVQAIDMPRVRAEAIAEARAADCEVRAALREAREETASARAEAAATRRERALAAIDRAMERMDARR